MACGDYDGVTETIPVTIRHEGNAKKALVHADRNGYFYAIDRTNGEFLFAKPFVRVTWSKGITPEGRPILNPEAVPTYEGVEVCPGAAGGKQWTGMAYSPRTHRVYVPAIENCAMFYNYGVKAKEQGLPPGPSGFQYIPHESVRESDGHRSRDRRNRLGGANAITDVGVHAGHGGRAGVHRGCGGQPARVRR